MLVRDSADYIEESKHGCMIDMYPVTESHELVPSPRVLNTHYRLDVLPKTFRGKKTVCGKNPFHDFFTLFQFELHCVKCDDNTVSTQFPLLMPAANVATLYIEEAVWVLFTAYE